jgi:membrane protein YdbS with pleckstrin-like domain
MSNLSRLLADNEELRLTARQHWFVPLAHLIADVVLIVLLIAAAITVPMAFRQVPLELVLFSTSVLGIAVAVSAVAEVLRWRDARVGVTDRRVLQTQGVVVKSVIDVPLETISETALHQTWLGRLFGFGDVDLHTSSDEGMTRLAAIRRPEALLEAIETARASYEGYLDRAVVRAYDNPRDIRALLEQLATLRDRGILSAAEFESKKRDLLSRI